MHVNMHMNIHNMYINMYIYIHIYTHTYTPIHTHIYTYKHTNTQTHIWFFFRLIFSKTHTRIWVKRKTLKNTHTYLSKEEDAQKHCVITANGSKWFNKFKYSQTCIKMHVNLYRHMFTQVYMSIYIYIHCECKYI